MYSSANVVASKLICSWKCWNELVSHSPFTSRNDSFHGSKLVRWQPENARSCSKRSLQSTRWVPQCHSYLAFCHFSRYWFTGVWRQTYVWWCSRTRCKYSNSTNYRVQPSNSWIASRPVSASIAPVNDERCWKKRRSAATRRTLVSSWTKITGCNPQKVFADVVSSNEWPTHLFFYRYVLSSNFLSRLYRRLLWIVVVQNEGHSVSLYSIHSLLVLLRDKTLSNQNLIFHLRVCVARTPVSDTCTAYYLVLE